MKTSIKNFDYKFRSIVECYEDAGALEPFKQYMQITIDNNDDNFFMWLSDSEDDYVEIVESDLALLLEMAEDYDNEKAEEANN